MKTGCQGEYAKDRIKQSYPKRITLVFGSYRFNPTRPDVL